MKKNKFTESRIAKILKQAENGVPDIVISFLLFYTRQGVCFYRSYSLFPPL